MTKLSLLAAVVAFSISISQAQNTSPYWSLAGNSNAAATAKLGTTNNIPLRLLTNNLERMRIGADGRVGIGTTATPGRFTLQGNGSVPSARWIAAGTPVLASFGESGVGNGDHIMAMASNTGSARAVLLLRRSRGTLAAPTAVVQGDFLGSLLASGYDGANFQNPASVDFFADDHPSSGQVPARISFSTGTNSATRAERMVIKANGNVGIGTSSPTGKLHVEGNSVFKGADEYGGIGISVAGQSYGLYSVAESHDDGVGIYASGYFGIIARSFDFAVNASGTLGGVYGSSSEGNGVQGYTGAPDAYAGYFSGNVYSTGYYLGSDEKLKQGVKDLNKGLDIIKALQPKTYRYRQDGHYALMNLPRQQQYGLLAQDVEKVLPQLVKNSTFDVAGILNQPDSNGRKKTNRISAEPISFKAVNYIELIPILIKAMQEQQAQMEAIDHQTEIEALRKEVAELKSMVAKLAQGGNVLSLSNASLGLANPNPATGITILSYTLPQESTAAYILVTDMKGSTIKRITVGGAGAGQVRLNTASLAAGTYTYSLFVNGAKVESKQLLIIR